MNKPITKYRVDFYYWYKDKGFVRVETADFLDYPPESAKEYVDYIEEVADFMGTKEQGYGMPKTDADAIWIFIVDNENDCKLSGYRWKNVNRED